MIDYSVLKKCMYGTRTELQEPNVLVNVKLALGFNKYKAEQGDIFVRETQPTQIKQTCYGHNRSSNPEEKSDENHKISTDLHKKYHLIE